MWTGRTRLQFDPGHEGRRATAREALALAREAGDPVTLAHVLKNYIHATWAPDTLAERTRLADELEQVAKTANDPALECWSAWISHNVLIESADFAAAEEAAMRCQTIAARLGQPSMKWFVAGPSAGFEVMRGDFERGEQLVNETFQIGTEAGQPDAFMVLASQISMIKMYQGGAEDLIGPLEEHARANPAIPAWQAALVGAYAWLGRLEEAAAGVNSAAADRFEHLPWDSVRMSALAMYTDAAVQSSATEAAAILYEVMEPSADQVIWNLITGYGHCQLWLGMLAAATGRHEQADRHFASANEFHHANGMLLFAAQGHLEWARALQTRGQRVLAEREAASALDLSREHGYYAIERLALALIQNPATASA